MKAEMSRVITKSVQDIRQEKNMIQSSASFDSVIGVIKECAEDGKRSCRIALGKIHYSVLPRLVALEYDIVDSNEVGVCVVSW